MDVVISQSIIGFDGIDPCPSMQEGQPQVDQASRTIFSDVSAAICASS